MIEIGVDGLAPIGVALLVGLLIGLDRERAEVRKARDAFAGVRTFPLIALAGCVSVLLAERVGGWLPIASLAAVGAVTVVAYAQAAREGHVGATTEIAAIATYLLGALAGAGELLLAGATGVAVAVLLVAKPRLEAFSRALTAEELAAVLELAVISVIVLPLLPNRGYGPWRLLNPREIWWVVVAVAGLSFLGFVAVRVLGARRGLAVTGAVGGLVSSTAVTLAMAERSREDQPGAHAAAAAAALASAVMAVRVLVFAGAINAAILARIGPPVMLMAATGALGAWLVARRDPRRPEGAGERIRNPFSLRSAVTFALIYAAVLVVVRAASERFGTGGMFVAAALSSLADVDAVTIAYTKLGPGSSAWAVPAAAITLAVVANTIVKAAIGIWRGTGEFRRHLALVLGAMALVGAVAGLVVYLR